MHALYTPLTQRMVAYTTPDTATTSTAPATSRRAEQPTKAVHGCPPLPRRRPGSYKNHLKIVRDVVLVKRRGWPPVDHATHTPATKPVRRGTTAFAIRSCQTGRLHWRLSGRSPSRCRKSALPECNHDLVGRADELRGDVPLVLCLGSGQVQTGWDLAAAEWLSRRVAGVSIPAADWHRTVRAETQTASRTPVRSGRC